MLRQRLRPTSPTLIEETDPRNGLVNLVDFMLVFACGLLVALVMSWNLQNVLLTDMTPEKRQQMLKAVSEAIQVEQGQELDGMPDVSKGQGGSGYQEMGRVYKDPKTGKLIMIKQ